MRRYHCCLPLVAVVAFLFNLTTNADAAKKKAATTQQPGPVQTVAPAPVAAPVYGFPTSSYRYGWFGAHYWPHMSDHRGFYGDHYHSSYRCGY